jgi:hypothetical protein
VPPSREEIEVILREFVEGHILVRRIDGHELRDDAFHDAVAQQIADIRERVGRLEGARESDTIHTGNTGRFHILPPHSSNSAWPKAVVGILKSPIAVAVAAAVGGFITHWIATRGH